MTHYIKIQFLEKADSKVSSEILGDAYLQALEILNASIENAYDVPQLFEQDNEEDCPEETELFGEIFETISSKALAWGVKVNLDAFEWKDIDIFLEYFLSFLKDEVQFLWKFHDTKNLQKREEFFRKLYFLEMDLREILSYIFFKTYFTDTDILKEIQVKRFNQKIQDIENDFFDVSFSWYKELLNLKVLKDTDREKYLLESDNFDDWKNKLLNRWIQEEIYRDFISSVNDELWPIEEFRNCIMHNRWYEKWLFQNFEKNYESLMDKLREFKSLHMSEEWNEHDLIVWKEYISLWNHTNFTKWKKYSLSKIIYSDSVFIWNDGNEDVFFDKDFHANWLYN